MVVKKMMWNLAVVPCPTGEDSIAEGETLSLEAQLGKKKKT